ncbi:hypothetical protein J8L98_24635 [Pseudoalteromonas sp. MMG013]|uniref:hypothetical protein n=1 Tax=Pseudoalteromonas sp. MMG013 TaxID=2822687 RepID=UPI001B37394F|nr:hypothetical protein [Pseudoalteromonas sp. MMG013]MBQ4864871.1 hypothetical protein [Pseudoalteromonas sp. MMG013]
MIQAFVFIFSILFSSYTLSCTFPIHGSEYDELIKVQKNDIPNSYHLTVPKKIKGSGSVKIYLSYTKEGGQAFQLAEATEELSFWFSWSVINGDFIASPKKEIRWDRHKFLA